MSRTITMPVAGRGEVRGLSKTMVATKTTTVTNEHGEQERLKAGVTFIHDPRHWLGHPPTPAANRRRPISSSSPGIAASGTCSAARCSTTSA